MPALDEASGDLFVWSILMCPLELARFFWRRCTESNHQYCISHALFAAAVARCLSRDVDEQASERLVGEDAGTDGVPGRAGGRGDGPRGAAVSAARGVRPFATEFGDLAKTLMNKCFDADQQAAVDAIRTEWRGQCWLDIRGPFPERLSPLKLAGYAQAEAFVGDPAFQSCVDRVWYGQLAPYKLLGRSRTGARERSPAMGAHEGSQVDLPFEPGDPLRPVFLSLSVGAAAVPCFVISAFYSYFWVMATCAGVSYGIIPFLMLGLASRTPQSSPSQAHLVRVCRDFYTAPAIKFLGRTVHFLLFVLLFTYVSITMAPDAYKAAEGVMHGWLILLLLQELRQVPSSPFCFLGWQARGLFFPWVSPVFFSRARRNSPSRRRRKPPDAC